MPARTFATPDSSYQSLPQLPRRPTFKPPSVVALNLREFPGGSQFHRASQFAGDDRFTVRTTPAFAAHRQRPRKQPSRAQHRDRSLPELSSRAKNLGIYRRSLAAPAFVTVDKSSQRQGPPRGRTLTFAANKDALGVCRAPPRTHPSVFRKRRFANSPAAVAPCMNLFHAGREFLVSPGTTELRVSGTLAASSLLKNSRSLNLPRAFIGIFA